eukprot:363628-Chlamydomonas_euryale.AAC.8
MAARRVAKCMHVTFSFARRLICCGWSYTLWFEKCMHRSVAQTHNLAKQRGTTWSTSACHVNTGMPQMAPLLVTVTLAQRYE